MCPELSQPKVFKMPSEESVMQAEAKTVEHTLTNKTSSHVFLQILRVGVRGERIYREVSASISKILYFKNYCGTISVQTEKGRNSSIWIVWRVKIRTKT